MYQAMLIISPTVVFLVGFDTVGEADDALGFLFFSSFVDAPDAPDDRSFIRSSNVLVDARGGMKPQHRHVITYARNMHNVVAVLCNSVTDVQGVVPATCSPLRLPSTPTLLYGLTFLRRPPTPPTLLYGLTSRRKRMSATIVDANQVHAIRSKKMAQLILGSGSGFHNQVIISVRSQLFGKRLR